MKSRPLVLRGLWLLLTCCGLVLAPARQDKAGVTHGIVASTSRDGLTWGNPVVVVDHVNTVTPMEDKPWLKSDNVPGSKHKGNIYLAWTKFDEYGSKKPEHKSHIYFARSKDGGKTFS